MLFSIEGEKRTSVGWVWALPSVLNFLLSPPEEGGGGLSTHPFWVLKGGGRTNPDTLLFNRGGKGGKKLFFEHVGITFAKKKSDSAGKEKGKGVEGR